MFTLNLTLFSLTDHTIQVKLPCGICCASLTFVYPDLITRVNSFMSDHFAFLLIYLFKVFYSYCFSILPLLFFFLYIYFSSLCCGILRPPPGIVFVQLMTLECYVCMCFARHYLPVLPACLHRIHITIVGKVSSH